MLVRFFLGVILFLSSLFSNQIVMEEIDVYTDGFRLQIEGTIDDSLGVSEARIYFKDEKQSTYYYFVSMECREKKCIGTLPLAQKSVKEIDYFFLYQNNGGNIYKSKELSVKKANKLVLPKWQSSDLDSRVVIKTEYAKIPKSLFGFKDYIRVEKVSIEEKIGVIAKVYEGNILGKEKPEFVDGIFAGEAEVTFLLSDSFKELFNFSYVDAGFILLGVIAANALVPGLLPF